jgi:RNA polymerase sigma-32 factor
MSKTTIALEAAVAAVIANSVGEEERPTARQRVNADRAFATILKLIAPRIRHFIRQYGLAGHWDDAEQCCAIGVHRAIQAYDPEKAQFTTFVNWQLRGELQSLRFRLMTDQRPSAKKVDATTVSLHAVTAGADGEETTLESIVEDDEALSRTEAGASDYLAANARSALVECYVDHLRKIGMEQLERRARANGGARQPVAAGVPRLRALTRQLDPAGLAALEKAIAESREVVERRMFEDATLDELGTDVGVTKERARQLAKRAAKTMSELAAHDPRFGDPIASAIPARPRRQASVQRETPLLPTGDEPHNRLSTVVALSDEATATPDMAREQGAATPELAAAFAEACLSSSSHARSGAIH